MRGVSLNGDRHGGPSRADRGCLENMIMPMATTRRMALRDFRAPVVPLIEPRIRSKRIFRRIFAVFRDVSVDRLVFHPRLLSSVFLSVDCGALLPSIEHREAIILGKTRNSRKKPLLQREGELMNGDRRTFEFRRVCANRIIFVCGGENPMVPWSMESRGISAERAEFLNVASWTNVKSREIYCYTHQQNFCTALLSYVPALRRWARHHQFLLLDNFSDKLLKQTSHRLGFFILRSFSKITIFCFVKKQVNKAWSAARYHHYKHKMRFYKNVIFFQLKYKILRRVVIFKLPIQIAFLILIDLHCFIAFGKSY